MEHKNKRKKHEYPDGLGFNARQYHINTIKEICDK